MLLLWNSLVSIALTRKLSKLQIFNEVDAVVYVEPEEVCSHEIQFACWPLNSDSQTLRRWFLLYTKAIFSRVLFRGLQYILKCDITWAERARHSCNRETIMSHELPDKWETAREVQQSFYQRTFRPV